MAHILLNPIFLGLAVKTASEIEDLLKELPINLGINRSHILYKDSHDFNGECGEECILFVAEKIKAKIKVDIVNENIDSPAFESRDTCRHGCTIAVRLGLSTNNQWKIGTAFHVGKCNANKGGGGGCIIN